MAAQFQCDCAQPPKTVAPAAFTTPARNICQPVAVKGSTETFVYFDSNVPSVQLSAAQMRTRQATSWIWPSVVAVRTCGQSRMHSPTAPRKSPIIPGRESLAFLSITDSISATHMGVTAKINADNPLGTYCSAQ